MAVGYSGTPLLKKLGIKPGMKIQLINAPRQYMQWTEQDISQQLVEGCAHADLVHIFTRSIKEWMASMSSLLRCCKDNPNLIIWVSWYKKSSQIPTDLTEDVIRQHAIQHDLVDIKVCAVSTDWSGLKLVVRKSKR